MDVNADFSSRAVVHAARIPWVPSPMKGVDRRMLDRIGDEVARATSIVRYAPGSAFSPHVHTGGEEFLVLDGVFQDEHGDFPTGSYVRNPPSTRHTPRSEPGCIIFVKLWQFDPEDRNQFSIDTASRTFEAVPDRPGVSVMPLHEDAREAVVLETWTAGADIALDAPGGLELLVLDGGFTEQGEAFEKQSWIRLPAGAVATLTTGPDGASVWIKRGHLSVPQRAPCS